MGDDPSILEEETQRDIKKMQCVTCSVKLFNYAQLLTRLLLFVLLQGRVPAEQAVGDHHDGAACCSRAASRAGRP